MPVFGVRAGGGIVVDADGNSLIDLGSGIAVTTVGNSAARVVDVVKAQVEEFTHTCFMVTPYESYVAAAEALNRLTPGDHEKRTGTPAAFRSPRGDVVAAPRYSIVTSNNPAESGRGATRMVSPTLPDEAEMSRTPERLTRVHVPGGPWTTRRNGTACALSAGQSLGYR